MSNEQKLTGKPSVDKVWLKYYSDEAIKSETPNVSIYEYLKLKNSKNFRKQALEYIGRKFTFEELFSAIDNTAKSLKQMGVNAGDIVTVCMPTTPEAIYTFYAINKIGAVINVIDPRSSISQIHEYIEEVDSKLVIMLDMFYDKVSEATRNTNVENIVGVSASDSLPFALNLGFQAKTYLSKDSRELKKRMLSDEKVTGWNDFYKMGNDYQNQIDSNYYDNQPAAIVHTGGTTGTPKGVVLTNENFNAMAHQYEVSGMNLQVGHRFLNIMPPFIAYGLVNSIHMPLSLGTVNVIVPSFDPKKFDELIVKHKPNHTLGAPVYFESLLNSKKLKNMDLSFFISAGAGGDHIHPNLEKRINSFLEAHKCELKLAKGYGMTELGSAVAICMKECNKLGSVGIPLINNTISIFDPETHEELSYNENGEICITGPTMMQGYYENEDETEKTIITHKDGTKWVHSKDIGYMDEDGLLYIVDRIKKIIVRAGFKVYPSIIEKLIMTHNAVYKCAVVGLPDELDVEVPKAYIILKDEFKPYAPVIEDEIKKLCTEALPEYSIPTEFEFRDSIPMTPLGKVDYQLIQQQEQNLSEEPYVKKLSMN